MDALLTFAPCCFFLMLILGLIALVIAWLITIIYACSGTYDSKPTWILIVILGGPLGALAYWIATPKSKATGVDANTHPHGHSPAASPHVPPDRRQ